MKKNILILCATISTFGLMAFGYINWNAKVTHQEKIAPVTSANFDANLGIPYIKQKGPDLVYKVESRFLTTISKEKLDQAKTIMDILPEKATNSIGAYQDVEVSVLDPDDDNKFKNTAEGEDHNLNPAQLKLLQSAEYTSNIYIKANFKRSNGIMTESYYGSLTYFISIIPEKGAEFIDGHEALIDYLRENSKTETAIIQRDRVQPGKVSFTVTKEGTIANVKLTSTSGYASVDKKLVELISTKPGKWNPATNSKGEKVEQELVFFFGSMGC